MQRLHTACHPKMRRERRAKASELMPAGGTPAVRTTATTVVGRWVSEVRVRAGGGGGGSGGEEGEGRVKIYDMDLLMAQL